MPGNFYISDAYIVNEGEIYQGDLIIREGRIDKIIRKGDQKTEDLSLRGLVHLNASGKYMLPGAIDDQVHFRDPGLTYKGDISTESKAAVAGGVTSFMDMPNTNPLTLSQDLLEDKYRLAAEKSLANFSFYMGASNTNLDEILKTDPRKVCGLKVFMGASTGNMLVDDPEALMRIFKDVRFLIATHCEDEPTIHRNAEEFRAIYGEDIPIEAHPLIRSEESCYRSTSLAIQLAREFSSRLHVLHLSTAHEMLFFDNELHLSEKRITAEVCIHHLWFSENDYPVLGNRIKWNPAIKSSCDREALWQALLEDRIDIIATDHAPHTREEKSDSYFKAPSGGPLIQHSLVAMLDFFHDGRISLEKIVEKMCHGPATCFRLEQRGFIREGYKADLVLVDLHHPWKVDPSNILYKCGWSPFEGYTFRSRVTHTFVNGNLVFEDKPELLNEKFDESTRGERLTFNN